MTDASFTGWSAQTRPSKPTVALPKPSPVPVSAPVLIGDVATPLGGETLLSLLWKRMDAGDPDDTL